MQARRTIVEAIRTILYSTSQKEYTASKIRTICSASKKENTVAQAKWIIFQARRKSPYLFPVSDVSQCQQLPLDRTHDIGLILTNRRRGFNFAMDDPVNGPASTVF